MVVVEQDMLRLLVAGMGYMVRKAESDMLRLSDMEELELLHLLDTADILHMDYMAEQDKLRLSDTGTVQTELLRLSCMVPGSMSEALLLRLEHYTFESQHPGLPVSGIQGSMVRLRQ
jgi:hypothetical protein